MKQKKQREPGAPHLLYRILYPLLSGPIRFFCRVHCTGRENIPMQGGCLVCANHISNADALMLGAVFPAKRQLHTMAKAELFSIPILSSIVRGIGGIKVQRGKADVAAIRECAAVIEQGEILVVFPQGTRCPGKDPNKTPIKAGAALLACRTECPVLPISISAKQMKFRFFRRIDITIGKPIPPQQIKQWQEADESYSAIAGHIFDAICRVGNFLPAPKEES